MDEKISSQTEESRIVEETEVREQTIDAVETTYSRATVSEAMEINEEDGEDMALAKVQLSENQENAAANEKKAAQLKSFSEQKAIRRCCKNLSICCPSHTPAPRQGVPKTPS